MPWAQGGPWSDSQDMWGEGPNDLSVGEGPGRWNASHLQRLEGTRVRP